MRGGTNPTLCAAAMHACVACKDCHCALSSPIVPNGRRAHSRRHECAPQALARSLSRPRSRQQSWRRAGRRREKRPRGAFFPRHFVVLCGSHRVLLCV